MFLYLKKIVKIYLLTNKKKKYYLKISYIICTKTKKIRITFPKIKLNITKNPEIERERYYDFSNVFVNLNLGRLELERVIYKEEPVCYYAEILEEYSKEMSIEEIEKELGYKIIIVNEKGK